eukprot:gene1489-1878_t
MSFSQTFKVNFEGDVRRFSYPISSLDKKVSLVQLNSKIIEIYHIDEPFVLTYVDEAGDNITISDEVDLKEAYNFQEESNTLILRLTIFRKSNFNINTTSSNNNNINNNNNNGDQQQQNAKGNLDSLFVSLLSNQFVQQMIPQVINNLASNPALMTNTSSNNVVNSPQPLSSNNNNTISLSNYSTNSGSNSNSSSTSSSFEFVKSYDDLDPIPNVNRSPSPSDSLKQNNNNNNSNKPHQGNNNIFSQVPKILNNLPFPFSSRTTSNPDLKKDPNAQQQQQQQQPESFNTPPTQYHSPLLPSSNLDSQQPPQYYHYPSTSIQSPSQQQQQQQQQQYNLPPIQPSTSPSASAYIPQPPATSQVTNPIYPNPSVPILVQPLPPPPQNIIQPVAAKPQAPSHPLPPLPPPQQPQQQPSPQMLSQQASEYQTKITFIKEALNIPEEKAVELFQKNNGNLEVIFDQK